MKISLPWPFKDDISGETYHILNALKKRNDIELVDNLDEADYIFFMMDIYNCWNCSWYSNDCFNQEILNKIKTNKDYHKHIIIDYLDFTTTSNSVSDEKLDKVFKYFKRSIVNRSNNSIINYSREIIPLSYAVREDFINYDNTLQNDKKYKYDICYLFSKSGQGRRDSVLNYIKRLSRKYKVFTGYVHNKNISCYYTNINTNYYDIMKSSKIIVTCNPDNQEGDHRLWEALLTGNIVMCDNILTPTLIDNPLIEGEHLIFYENRENLYKKIDYFLLREEEREKIGIAGREYCQKYHTFDNRVDFIIKKLVS